MEDGDRAVQPPGLLPLGDRRIHLPTRQEQRAQEEVRGRILRVHLQGAPQDGEGVGPGGEDVARGESRGGGEVGRGRPARLLAAVAAVVGDEWMVLGKDVAGLRGNPLARIPPLEQLQRVRVEAEAHVLPGQGEHPLGLAGQVEPQRLSRLAELHRFVPQQDARGVEGEPVGEARAGEHSGLAV